MEKKIIKKKAVIILFAWLGLLCFVIPLFISLLGGGKKYCNRYNGRGQILSILGNKYKLLEQILPLFPKDIDTFVVKNVLIREMKR